MLALLLLPILFTASHACQNPTGAGQGSPVVVLSFSWFKDRQAAEKAVAQPPGPQPAMIAANKNFERNRRINASAAERDPNLDTVDGRSAALDKIMQESREQPPIDGYTYKVRFQNGSAKLTQTIYWEYQFKETANPANVSRRRFVCALKIKPQKDKELEVFSTLGPSNVIDIKNLTKGTGNQFEESILIHRIEYDDGSTWQRKDWDFDEAKLTAKARDDRSAVCRSF